MPRPKVLIVDDNPVDAGMLRRHLSSENINEYHILVAETGEEGLDLAAEFKPDVILLDFDLPDMDGLEYLHELRSRGAAEEDPPVLLAVTGQSDPRVAADLIRAGAEDYISKSSATPESVKLAVRQGVRTRLLRTALAERARERERSREELVASLDRASRVAAFSEALSKSLSVQALLESVAELAIPSLADACFVDLVEDGRLVRRFIRASGSLRQLENLPAGRILPFDAHEGAAKVLRSGTCATYARSWLPSLARWDSEADAAIGLGTVESAIAVPLIFDGTPLGAITLLSGRRLESYAQDVAEEFGRRTSAALTNARAFEAERAAKQASEEARRRLAILSKVSELFSRSLEWRATVREMMGIVVPAVADYASVSLLEGTETHVVASSTENVHLRPRLLPAGRQVKDLPEYHPDIKVMRRYSGAGRTLDSMEDESGSFIRVPIGSPAGNAIGEFVLSTSGERRLSLDDLGLAEDLGHRIGMYIETAHAFERERSIARSLQRSLLPSDIPLVPGAQFAARCVPGVSGVDVGGDWYDIIPLREGYVAFAVGDVAGRGLIAAATMGQLRSSLRAYLLEGLGPGEALSRLNAFILSQERMQYATVMLGVLQCSTGRVRMACAGHLPPISIDSEQGVHSIALQPSLPVGVFGDQQFVEENFMLSAGQSVVLFTDGLVESRYTDLETGTDDLAKRLLPGSAPEQLLQQALSSVSSDSVDDVTFLALRYLGVGAAVIDDALPHIVLTMPAVPKSAARVRRHLYKFCEQAGMHGARAFDLQLAVGEAVANAIEHAYNGAQQAIFSVHARLEDGEVLVDVLDQGRWREGVPTPRGQLSERGRGVSLMRALCDRVRIDRTLVGTRIQLGLQLEEPQATNAFA